MPRRPFPALLGLALASAAAVRLPAMPTTPASRARGARAAAPRPTPADSVGAREAAAPDPGPRWSETYLPSPAAAGGVPLRRWGDRVGRPVRVWIAPGAGVPGWQPAFAAAVRGAVGEWAAVGLPVRLAVVASPTDADVRVTWTPRLAMQRAGVTHWSAAADGRLTRARIEVATWASDGTPADAPGVRRIALHELGHALGLEHSPDTGDAMAAWVRAGRLSARDRATARLLYALPRGHAGAASGPGARPAR